MRVKLWGTAKDSYLQLLNEGKEWNMTFFPLLKRNVICRAKTNLTTLFRIEYTPVTGHEEGSYWVNAELLSDEESTAIMNKGAGDNYTNGEKEAQISE